MPAANSLFEAIVAGDATSARAVTEQELAGDTDPLLLVNDHMTPAMAEVGRRFDTNEFFVPELLLAARAMKAAMELVRPLLAARDHQPVGRVAVGTVKGDMHDIGKNLVAAMLEGGGFEVTDLGVNVSPQDFIKTIQERRVQIIGISALLTTTMMGMKTTIEAIREAGLRDRVKVLIGGAPITRKFAEEIGADGYGDNAVEAVAIARKVLAIR